MVSKAKQESELEAIKDTVRSTREYWMDNLKIFREYTYMVFKTSVSDDARAALKALNKPAVEFNILEAMISRIVSEFSKQEPSLYVRAADGVPFDMINEDLKKQMQVVEGYIREILMSQDNDNLQYNLFREACAGGYSAARVYVDHMDSMSFEYKIEVKKCFNSQLCGWDAMAKDSHKGDGEYCFEIFPMRKADFDRKYGKELSDNMQYSKSVGGFSWSYKGEANEKIILVCEYFKKKRKKIKISKLSNGHVINDNHYDKIVEEWNEQFIEQAPLRVDTRETEIESIDRYLICENKIIEHNETDFAFLPIVFFDGNSQMIQDSDGGAIYQMVRPFVYHAKGIQQTKNVAGQTIVAEIQNMVAHKMMIPLEGVPTAPQHQNAYRNMQIADTFIYNAYDQDNPDKPIPPPREIQRTILPPIVNETFVGSDSGTQMILGSYDSVLGTNSNHLSGKAIQQGALQSNGAAMPFLINHIKALNQIGKIILDLIPKYIVTPRTIPIKKANGKRDYQKINNKKDPQSISMAYRPSNFELTVEAGVNSNIAKEAALESMTKLMAVSPGFAEMVEAEGLEILVDNLDIRGSESLKVAAEKYMKMKAEQAQQPPPPTDTMILAQTEKEIKTMEVQASMEKAQGEHAIQTAKVSVEKQNADTKFLQLMMQVEQDARKEQLEAQRTDAENAKDAIEIAMKIAQGMADRRVS